MEGRARANRHTWGAARTSGADRVAAKVRTAGAILVLLLFWAALARSMWPEFAPVLLQFARAARGAGVVPIETAHLEVRNASRADERTLNEAVARLEADLAAIEAVAADQANSPHPASPTGGGEASAPRGKGGQLVAGGAVASVEAVVADQADCPYPTSPPAGVVDARQGGTERGQPRSRAATDSFHPALRPAGGEGDVARIPVTVMEGSGPALSDGTGLILLHDGGRIDLSTAPFFLALLREGSLSMPGLHLFVDGGYAVYVVEKAGLARSLLGQSSDAWTALLRDAGAYVPLEEAWEAGLPRGERETAAALRTLLEGGSFVRWVAETQGVEAVQALRDGVPAAEAIGMSPGEAEAQWLDTVAGVEGQPCERALPEASPLQGYCGTLLQ